MTSGHCQRRHVRQKGSARIRVPLPNPCAIAESMCHCRIRVPLPCKGHSAHCGRTRPHADHLCHNHPACPPVPLRSQDPLRQFKAGGEVAALDSLIADSAALLRQHFGKPDDPHGNELPDNPVIIE